MGIILTVGGRHYADWVALRVTRRLDALCGVFSLTSPDPALIRNIRTGEPAKLTEGHEPLIDGFIEALRGSLSVSGTTIEIHGRDKTGDLVDSSAVVKADEYRKQTLLQIASDLCQPFGIAVESMVTDDVPFDRWKVRPGETVFETLERAASRRHQILSSAGVGIVRLTKVGAGASQGTLTEGEDIIDLSTTIEMSGRHSEYIVRSQIDEDQQVEARITDEEVARYRPLLIVSQNGLSRDDAKRRVDWEKTVRRGRSRKLNITVQGFRSKTGRIWSPNDTVVVKAATFGIDSRFLIVGVELMLDQGGTLTMLDLQPEDAFAPEPDHDRKKDRKGSDEW